MNPKQQKSRDTSKDLCGAVLVFKPGVTYDQAADLLAALAPFLQSTSVNTFNPAWGEPVWYIP